MARFKITRISSPISFWDVFCESVKEFDKLTGDAIEYVQYNSNNILDLLKKCSSVLVFGQVQSGKTLNYSGLIARTFENNFDLVIVLAGTKSNLVDQTYERLKNYFNNSPEIDVDKMGTGLNLEAQLSKLSTFPGRKQILVTLKHQDYLKGIRYELHKNSVMTLIIDDEADQASLNTLEYYSNRNNVSEMSRIYKELRTLCMSESIKLIQYTATPQALFLLSTDNALSPEKYFVQTPPNSYFGIDELLVSPVNHIIEIEDFESSFRYVIDQYIKNCYLLISEHEYDENLCCLIHSDWKTAQLKLDYQDVVNFINNYSFDSVDWYQIENQNITIQQFADYFRGNCFIYDVFSKKTVVDWNKHQFIILVGGNMLERGFTIPGLITTILTRNSKSTTNGDTLQQRCRFLGYRNKIKPFLRVYTTKDIIDELKDYNYSQLILLNEINESGNTSDFSKSFVMEYLLPTRQNVLPATLKRSLKNNIFIAKRGVLDFSIITELQDSGYLLNNKIPILELIPFLELKKLLMFMNLPTNLIMDGEIHVILFGSPEIPRIRTFDINGKINELFQGRNKNYPGDRYLFPNQQHLQIHLVMDKNSTERYIFLAILNGSDLKLVYLDNGF
jgi:hypothetical protein